MPSGCFEQVADSSRRYLRLGEIHSDMDVDAAMDLESFDETICLHMLNNVEPVLFVDIEEALRLEPSGVDLLAPLQTLVEVAQRLVHDYLVAVIRHG